MLTLPNDKNSENPQLKQEEGKQKKKQRITHKINEAQMRCH